MLKAHHRFDWVTITTPQFLNAFLDAELKHRRQSSKIRNLFTVRIYKPLVH